MQTGSKALNKMVDITPILVNVKRPNSPTMRNRFSNWITKQNKESYDANPQLMLHHATAMQGPNV
jgi:hypothetical protein